MIYEPTAFYVGTADDHTYYEYSRLDDQSLWQEPRHRAIRRQGEAGYFIAEVKKLAGPGIENFVVKSRADSRPDPLSAVGRQFRFMGQRFVPDSRILQELTHPKADGRNFPKGLDAFAAMGSDRALEILKKKYDLSAFAGYDTQMVKMRKEMADTPTKKWQSNLYYGWLWSLQSEVEPAPKGYPAFMLSDAWIDKSLLQPWGRGPSLGTTRFCM